MRGISERVSPEIGFSFEQKKWAFFSKLGMRGVKWFKAHDTLGRLWDGPKKDRWENVSEHCLVESARVEVLADLLGLSAATKEELFGAAILHDFNKKEEIVYTAQHGRTPESFAATYEMATKKLIDAGFPASVIEIADAVGAATTKEMEDILQKSDLTEHDIARMVMHYVDDYTLNAEWAGVYDGVKNDLDRRMDANDANQKYAKLAAAGYYVEQRRVGNLVEQKLASLIEERSGVPTEAKYLPEKIDQIIKNAIEGQI